ncbi:MAG: hypothetical protein ACE3L7_18105 [Candidatus Pristimantibacillus sp.]
MKPNEKSALKDQQYTEAAWERLAKKLADNEPSPLWSQWSEQGAAEADRHIGMKSDAVMTVEAEVKQLHTQLPPFKKTVVKQAKSNKQSATRRWVKRNTAKIGTVSAAAILAVVIMIPSTNEALASLLNKFKMNEVIVVQEDDLQKLLSTFSNDEGSLETVNQFGEFERVSTGEYQSHIQPEEAFRQFGINVPKLSLGDKTDVGIDIAPSKQYTFKLKVDEINDIMKKLGAKKLIPDAVDGKLLQLMMDQTLLVRYSLSNNGDHDEYRTISVSYLAVPAIEIDPSIDAKEAFEAIVQLPALPENIRNALVQSSRLDEGKVPLPLITNGDPLKMKINGVDVYLEKFDKGRYWEAIWMMNDKMVTASFNGIEQQASIENYLSELVAND